MPEPWHPYRVVCSARCHFAQYFSPGLAVGRTAFVVLQLSYRIDHRPGSRLKYKSRALWLEHHIHYLEKARTASRRCDLTGLSSVCVRSAAVCFLASSRPVRSELSRRDGSDWPRALEHVDVDSRRVRTRCHIALLHGTLKINVMAGDASERKDLRPRVRGPWSCAECPEAGRDVTLMTLDALPRELRLPTKIGGVDVCRIRFLSDPPRGGRTARMPCLLTDPRRHTLNFKVYFSAPPSPQHQIFPDFLNGFSLDRQWQTSSDVIFQGTNDSLPSSRVLHCQVPRDDIIIVITICRYLYGPSPSAAQLRFAVSPKLSVLPRP